MHMYHTWRRESGAKTDQSSSLQNHVNSPLEHQFMLPVFRSPKKCDFESRCFYIFWKHCYLYITPLKGTAERAWSRWHHTHADCTHNFSRRLAFLSQHTSNDRLDFRKRACFAQINLQHMALVQYFMKRICSEFSLDHDLRWLRRWLVQKAASEAPSRKMKSIPFSGALKINILDIFLERESRGSWRF